LISTFLCHAKSIPSAKVAKAVVRRKEELKIVDVAKNESGSGTNMSHSF